MRVIERVGLVGGGLVGSGIAEVNARAGIDTVLVEVTAEAAKVAAARVEASVRRAESRGKIVATEVEGILTGHGFYDHRTTV